MDKWVNVSLQAKQYEEPFLQKLEDRQNELSLKFATKKCLNNSKFEDLFPENKTHWYQTRHKEKYTVPFCNTERMKQSGIMNMIQQLNSDHDKTRKT